MGTETHREDTASLKLYFTIRAPMGTETTPSGRLISQPQTLQFAPLWGRKLGRQPLTLCLYKFTIRAPMGTETKYTPSCFATHFFYNSRPYGDGNPLYSILTFFSPFLQFAPPLQFAPLWGRKQFRIVVKWAVRFLQFAPLWGRKLYITLLFSFFYLYNSRPYGDGNSYLSI
ncbi:MAG: hypothetical protein JG769_436 [Oscillospiraceae bacterium]|nr:hypothetical protein [Oscillospiraceae bacterium]